MIGAHLGAAVVALVAFFDEPQKALIVIIYFIVYQQLENYARRCRASCNSTVGGAGAPSPWWPPWPAAPSWGSSVALLAIPFAAGALLIYEEVLVPRQQQH